jgi:hypothetical protein
MLDLFKALISLFIKPSDSPQAMSAPAEIAQPEPVKEVIEPVTNAHSISIDDWITASGKYPDRKNSPELTYDVRSAAMLLVDKINELNRRLKIGKLSISSGFRPSDVNSQVPNAAKKSGHMRGFAIDIYDPNGELDALLSSDIGQDALEALGLWQEHPDHTKTWAHIDYISRPVRERLGCKKRQFMP